MQRHPLIAPLSLIAVLAFGFVALGMCIGLLIGLAVAAALGIVAIYTSQMKTVAALYGNWSGGYVCEPQGNTGLSLKIYEVGPNHTDAIVSFRAAVNCP